MRYSLPTKEDDDVNLVKGGETRKYGEVGFKDTVATRRAGSRIGIVRLETDGDGIECVTVLWKLMQTSTDNKRVLGYYVSFLILVLPEIADQVLKSLDDANFSVYTVLYPSDALFVDEDIMDDGRFLTVREVMTVLGVLLLVPFRIANNTNNFSHYFSKKLSDLCGILGTKPGDLGIVLNLTKATYIREKISLAKDVKKHILTTLLSPVIAKELILGQVANYVTNILSWTDMNTYYFILTTLVRTGSPVLFHPDVLSETKTMCTAMKAVTSIEHPQFFRFFGPKKEQALLDRSRYPILFPVCIRLLEDQFPSFRQHSGTQKINTSLLKDLVELHKHYAFKIAKEDDDVNLVKDGETRKYGEVGFKDTIATRRPGLRIGIVRLETDSDGNECVTVLWKLMQTSTDNELVLGYYISFLILVLPEIADQVLKSLDDAKFSVYTVHYPSDALFVDEDIMDDGRFLTVREVMTVLGVLLFVPFKRANTNNFSHYFSKRLSALCGILGTESGDLGIALNLTKANYIREKISLAKDAKRHILTTLLSPVVAKDSILGRVANYVTNILSWTDMTTYHIILTTLVRTGSPVLHHPDVLSETETICTAIKAVSSIEHPQFFRFFGPKKEQALLDRSRYPILFPVSIRLLEDRCPSVRQLAGTQKMNMSLLKDLVELHKHYARTSFKIPVSLTEYLPKCIDPDLHQAAVTKDFLQGYQDSDIQTIAAIMKFHRMKGSADEDDEYVPQRASLEGSLSLHHFWKY